MHPVGSHCKDNKHALGLLEKRVLMKILGQRREYEQKDAEIYLTVSFIATLHQVSIG